MSSTTFTSCLRCFSTRAGPKPFPLSYNVGVDIAKISRFEAIITGKQRPHKQTAPDLIHLPSSSADQSFVLIQPELRHFIRKVFNYCEWPRLELALKSYDQAPDDSKRVSALAEYLAGRWAAKEAAIKAHSHRRLHYRDVIVLYQRDVSGINVLQDANAPVVLINPSRPEVHMSGAVALQRGLWQPHNLVSSTVPDSYRLARTQMQERQVARVSISHDGGYAVAVVYALDEPSLELNLDPIVDDGQGEPIHEPLIGDVIYRESL